MKRLAVVLIIVPLFLAAGLFYRANVTAPQGAFIYKRIYFIDIIGILEFRLGLKVALAETPYSKIPHATNMDVLNETLAIPPEERTEIEKDRIHVLTEFFKKYPNLRSGSNIKQELYTISIPIATPTEAGAEKLIKKICALDQNYRYAKSNTIYVLYDKDSLVNKKTISLKFADASALDVLRYCSILLGADGIGLDSKLPSDYSYSNTKITLNLNNVTLCEAFSRLAESLGPKIIWRLHENMGGSVLTFYETTIDPDTPDDPLLH